MFRRASLIVASVLSLAPFLILGGCSFESDLVSGLECTDGETRADGATCSDGFWVGGNNLDASNDASVEEDAQVSDDAETEMGCVAESDEEFCRRLGRECGIVEELNNCGTSQQVSCGACPNGQTCLPDQTCQCDPESPEEFCARLNKDCDVVTDSDNCGIQQTYDCGECDGAEECGERQANVCGCPCNIDGTCYPDGAVNPEDQCEVCDTGESTTGWTLDVGRTCDDEDLCTINDVCSGDGTCEGAPKDCSSEDGECRAGMCDASTGNCFGMAETGTPCSSDGVTCTDDVCAAGVCEHNLTGGCLIDNTCYADGVANPTNGCEACIPATSSSDWSNDNGGSCDDGLSCTTDTCMGGTCQSSLSAGNCLIDGACYSDGTDNMNNACETCLAGTDSGNWSLKPTCCEIGGTTYADGAANPAEPCQVCDPGSNRTDWSLGNCCDIGGNFFGDGVLNPTNDCQECSVADSTSDWTNLGSMQSCCPDQGANWKCNGAGMCQKQVGGMETMVCPLP